MSAKLPSSPNTAAKEGEHEPESSGSSARTANHNTVALKIISSLNKCNYQKHSLHISHHEVLRTPQELKEERSTQVGDAVPKFQEFPIRIYQKTRKNVNTKQRRPWQLLEKDKTDCGAMGTIKEAFSY